MLTEKQAWEKLARAWNNPECDGKVPYVLDHSYGICHALSDLRRTNDISDTMENRMVAKAENPGERDCWRWPLNCEGAKARAAFCRKQAKLCSRKRKR